MSQIPHNTPAVRRVELLQCFFERPSQMDKVDGVGFKDDDVALRSFLGVQLQRKDRFNVTVQTSTCNLNECTNHVSLLRPSSPLY